MDGRLLGRKYWSNWEKVLKQLGWSNWDVWIEDHLTWDNGVVRAAEPQNVSEIERRIGFKGNFLGMTGIVFLCLFRKADVFQGIISLQWIWQMVADTDLRQIRCTSANYSRLLHKSTDFILLRPLEWQGGASTQRRHRHGRQSLNSLCVTTRSTST